MSITLDSMVRMAMQTQQVNVWSANKADVVTNAFDLASQRIGNQLNETNVQLSSFGQIKSSFVDVQNAGKALTSATKSGTSEDITKAVQSFADAYNKATTGVNTAINGDGKSPGVLVDNGHANLARSDLKSITISGSVMHDLKSLGVTLLQNGTMSIDPKALLNAVNADPATSRDILSRVGAHATQVAQSELVGTGNISSSVNTLNISAKFLAAKAAEQQVLATNSQNQVQQLTATLNSSASAGIAAYTKIFSL